MSNNKGELVRFIQRNVRRSVDFSSDLLARLERTKRVFDNLRAQT
jgi:hypothetical protein